jgi:hypothetical protein
VPDAPERGLVKSPSDARMRGEVLPPRLFISSSWHDRGKVMGLREELSKALTGWVVTDDLARAKTWQTDATRLIEGASAFAFVASTHSCDSANCTWELQCAELAEKPVVNVQLVAELPEQLRGRLAAAPIVVAAGREPADVARQLAGLLFRLSSAPTRPTAG